MGEVGEIHNGRDYKHLQPGNIPVYGTSGYMLSVDDALSWNDDAVGIGRKGTIDKPCILRAPFWTVDTLFFVTPRSSTPLEFLFTLFESVNWKSKDESTGVPSLTKQAIVNTAVKVPDTSEQHQIGVFFSTLDSLIAAAERQEALLKQKKQAYLQLMFPREGETQPRLRFSGFIQNWRMHRMSEMVAPLNSIQQIMPDRDIEYRLWSVPSFQLGVPENVRGSRIMSSKLVLERDDILLSKINPRIQRIWRVDSDGTLPDVGSTEWVVFRAKPSKASPLFLKALLSSPLFYRYMVSTEKGATGSQKRADKTLLMSSCYWLPSLSEQQRIGAFFHLVDATLLTVQRNLAGLKELKRAYLQRMFI